MVYTLTVIRLITRDKWTQEPLIDQRDAFHLDFWYNLNGEKKRWDIQVC